ncbi:MAG: GC-type dockerin domain-anchored protein [Phycisphaerales bacterium JB039]
MVSAQELYLADFDKDLIHELDRDSGALLRSIPAPGNFATGLASYQGELLVNNYTGCSDDRVYRLNPSTSAIIDSYPSPDCPIDGLTLDPSGKYLIGLAPSEEQLIVFEPETGAVEATIQLPRVDGGLRGVASLGGLVYVSGELTRSLYSYELDVAGGSATPVDTLFIDARCPGLTSDGEVLFAYDIGEHRLLEIDPGAGVVVATTLPSSIGSSAGLVFSGPSCFADCDGDGELTFFDFLCFQNAFSAGDPAADCYGDGELTFFDFLCFQNAFSAGCP